VPPPMRFAPQVVASVVLLGWGFFLRGPRAAAGGAGEPRPGGCPRPRHSPRDAGGSSAAPPRAAGVRQEAGGALWPAGHTERA